MHFFYDSLAGLLNIFLVIILSLIMAENLFCQMTSFTAISYFATHPGKKEMFVSLLITPVPPEQVVTTPYY